MAMNLYEFIVNECHPSICYKSTDSLKGVSHEKEEEKTKEKFCCFFQNR